MLSRTGYTGELCYEIYCHPKDAITIWDAIWEAGNDFNLVKIRQFLPWFIFGFILLAILRSLGTISDSIGQSVFDATKIIFSVSMVGIGMGVDIREIVNLGPKIALTVLSIMGFMITAGIVGTSILVLTR